MAVERSTITVGEKGSSLSSSSVYKVASGIASVRIDSTAIEGLSTEALEPPSKRSSFGVPKGLTIEESRAGLVVLLNKLLSSSTKVSSVLPVKILEILDSNKADNDTLEWDSVVLDKSCAWLIGLCSIIDYKATTLSKIVDSVASLSCEATKADVTLFQSLVSGDGFGHKDAISIARDLNRLLSGSKAVGEFEIKEISKIPLIHGKFREVAESLHSYTRVGLSTSVNSSGVDEVLGSTLSALSMPVKILGECSFLRAKLCFESIGNENVRSGLSRLFEKTCVEDDKLKKKKGYDSLVAEEDEDYYCKLAHELNESLGIVWSIVGFEAVAAFFALAGGQLFGEKEAVVLGNGTRKIIQFIRDRLVVTSSSSSSGGGDQMEQWVEQIFNLFNSESEGDGFDSLLETLNEIGQSNENSFKIPKGTRDFGKDEMLVRKKAFSSVEKVFERHGATALDTPVFEMRETLMAKYGEDSKLIYDLADQGGERCSLRYDLTIPFARYVAMNGFKPFRRYQIDKVYRRDNVSKGRYREFYQCDFDIAGSYERMGPDFEVVKMLTELLDELKIGDYEVKVNHRKLLNGMLEICGVPPEKFKTICSSIDKLDKISFEQVKKEMVEVKGLSSEIADKIGKYVLEEKGAPMELLSKLRQEGSPFLANEPSKEALDDLSFLFKALERSKCIHRIVFDLSLARGLDYYTGVIFEAVCIGAEVGSIGAGGRYDNLIGKFGTTKESDKQPKQVPSVGMSLGIERVLLILEDQRKKEKENEQQKKETETQVLVSIRANSNKLDENELGEAAELVSQLWKAGISAEFLVHKRWDKHIDRAQGIPWMVFVGKQEVEEGVVTLKKIDGRSVVEEIKNVPRDTFVGQLLKRL